MNGLFQGPGGPTIRTDLPLPPIAEGDAMIRLSLGGVCATDLEIAKGYMGFEGVMGHEFVGVVEEVGSSAHANWVGTRVVGDINCSCGSCSTCQAGRPTHCPQRTVLGIVGRDGAFQEQFALPVANLHAVPPAVSDDAAVFVEPLAAACQILEQVHVRPSHSVAVLGIGRLGQMCVRVLALTGAEVVAFSRNPKRATDLPPGVAVHPVGQAPSRCFDRVVDTTGNPEGLRQATALVRPRGTIILKTTVHEATAPPPTPWVLDEITLVGSRCGPFAPALRLLASGRVDPTPLITARYELRDAVRALDAASRREHVKVVIAGNG